VHENLWTAFHGDALVMATDYAQLVVEWARFSDDRNSAALVASISGRVVGRFIRIENQHGRPCGGPGGDCEEFGAGVGIGAYLGASMDVAVFGIRQMAFVGVQIAAAGVMDLYLGHVTGCPIGLNVQGEGFDLRRTQNYVLFFGNETNFDAARLPVPGAG